MSNMAERPILFSGEMVKAILDERKTQTRRPVKLSRPLFAWQKFRCSDGWPGFIDLPEDDSANPIIKSVRRRPGKRCPFGGVGDRLWVRETFYCDNVFAGDLERGDSVAEWLAMTYYRADYADEHAWADAEEWAERTPPWSPSIHMPRWASRLTLEITEVRVEQLQDISEEDARAEGVAPVPFCKAGRPARQEHVEAFEALWDRAYAKTAPWSSNPFVWVLSFKRVESAQGKAVAHG